MPKSGKGSAKQSTADQTVRAAVLAERRRISRELHDRVLQHLSSMRLRAEICRREFITVREVLEKELEIIETTADKSIAEIRRLLADNETETDLAAGTLERRLREEMEIFRARAGIDLEFLCTIRPHSLREDVERELYFALREGIINVIRHARASELKLSLSQDGPVCHATLTDNGAGFDPSNVDSGSHYGLRIIRERIETVGGRVEIVSAPGEGTRLSIEVPAQG